VRARLTLHGTFAIEGAQMIEEEEYEEVVKEKRELPPSPAADGDAEMKPADGEGAEAKAAEGEDAQASPETNGDKAEDGTEKKAEPAEKKEPEKKFEWVDVKKTKKRTKRTDLKITPSSCPGLGADKIQKLMDAETAMQAEMREIVETDEKRNDLESYILTIRSKIEAGAEYGDFISSADREAFSSELMKAEDWLYDTFDATKTMYIDKLDELKKTGDAAAWRCKESGMRAEWIQAVTGTISNYRSAAANPGDKFGHIDAEKLGKIAAGCDELEQWLKDTREKQEAMPKHESPVLLCADMEKKSQELAKMADDILKEPKPEPPKEEKKEEEASQEEEKKPDEETKNTDVDETKEAQQEAPRVEADMDVD